MISAYNTRWAETVISNHAPVAREEMKLLSNEFIQLARSKEVTLPDFEKLANYI